MTLRRGALALGVLLLVAAGVIGVSALFSSRDAATLEGSTGLGVQRAAGEQPAVAPGNVVLLHSDERLTAALRDLARDTGGEATPQVVSAGQAVLVRRRPGLRVAVSALTSGRRLDANGPGDARLRQFIEYWLGRRDAG